MRKFAILLISIILSLPSFSQVKDSTASTYVARFPDKFFVWPVIKKRSLSFDITNRTDRRQSLSYNPNNSFSMGLGVYVFEVGVELTLAVPINERSTNTYGTSDVRDLRANFFGNGWGVEAFTQKYKGFYVPNNSVLNNTAFIKRPDIKLSGTGLNGIYIFNKEKFSLKAAYNYSERQLKSGGSMILTGTLTTLKMNTDSSVVDTQNAIYFTANANVRNLKYSTLSVAAGYTHTLVYRSFFLSGALSMGPAHNWLSYQVPGEADKYDILVNVFTDVRIAIGYNSEHFFGGMSLIAQSKNIRFEDIQFTSTSASVKLLLGYRFKEAGILKKRAKDYIPKGI